MHSSSISCVTFPLETRGRSASLICSTVSSRYMSLYRSTIPFRVYSMLYSEVS
ncbi:MAG: hypothetical protein IKQ60_05390 [Candidatus Methanomethylophilaceae archaeon]|nr:hypothetical protein [Candidatus Methanomethylophilaceae archaeon]